MTNDFTEQLDFLFSEAAIGTGVQLAEGYGTISSRTLPKPETTNLRARPGWITVEFYAGGYAGYTREQLQASLEKQAELDCTLTETVNLILNHTTREAAMALKARWDEIAEAAASSRQSTAEWTFRAFPVLNNAEPLCARPVPAESVNARLVKALKNTAQTLAWQCFGECRGFSEVLLSPNFAIDDARAAIAAAEAQQAEPVRLTDGQINEALLQGQGIHEMFARAIEAASLRANGFKVEG